ncbi:hypothetical protein BASA81_010986 [Batrachochytrium salamandrivorans]|nr:hypothetical protein BASA81_010986 [Batrachochytrium salamandrivorans]
MSRPEHSTAPAIFYDETEARKYASSSRMNAIQREITTRAIELLNLNPLDPPKLLLDVGCGSGLSGQVVSEHGHYWVGMDISPSMLIVAQENLTMRHADEEEEDDDDEEEEDDMEEELPEKGSAAIEGAGDLILRDIGHGLNFRPNSFDGCVSISAVQWLCNSYDKTQVPMHRLRCFFSSLYALLRKGARAVIQLYPETPAQMEQITHAAMGAGFTGGVVVDYPNSAKAKKYYLVLFSGGSQSIPQALGTTETGRNKSAPTSAEFETRRSQTSGRVKKRSRGDQPTTKSKDWIDKKKDRQRKQGREVRPDSKFSGRKRSSKF